MNILEIYNQRNNFGKLLEIDFEVIQPGNVKFSMPVLERHLATKNAAHGGAIAGFMDAVIGVTALSKVSDQGKVVSTVEFKINYLKAGFIGDVLTGKGLILRAGKTLLTVEGRIYNQNEDLIATAVGTLNAYPFEKSGLN